MTRTGKSRETESRFVVVKGWEEAVREEGQWLLMSQIIFWDNENVPELECGDDS